MPNSHETPLPQPSEWMTPREVAEHLRLRKVDVVRTWIAEGLLPASQLPNRRYLVRRADVDALPVPIPAGDPA